MREDLKKSGLTIERTFSNDDVNPHDEAVWTRRTAEIKAADGSIVFRQEGCEFPDTWSQQAVDITASKYFYGDVKAGNGSPRDGKREYSARQLVQRVAGNIATWGLEDGYFATLADADRFDDELAWLCLNQHGAFNSPVWFNVGLWDEYQVEASYDGFYYDHAAEHPCPIAPGAAYQHPQGSACFILGVGDSIPQIYERAAIEGRLFKYGSGCGTNNSSIRSMREVVAGGGRPSGPISFMRVYDAVAKVTKSGGKTRRAAKMEVLDDWHPDILEFIQCKGLEEAKARALINQGYPSDFNGESYDTVCFQNSNMSTRLSDEFMEKVEAPFEVPNWQTRAVTTGTEFNANGERMPAYDAGKLFNEIAIGTHRCGDPGVHFTDTINRWHTCKAAGPINASNPCSEYIFLDDSACNLASLNLLKFVDADGYFDAIEFMAAVRIFIIAQEILVDRCGYPTEAICRNSHDYRPLGLGYANLGTLLMTRGLAYDSDEGRAYAATITAIMHGAANLASIDLATVKGSFRGYEANRDSMLQVMRQHGIAIADINAPSQESDRLKSIAVAIWCEVLAQGPIVGFRNAQVTLLAPTGTIAFMMDCDTTGVEPEIALVKHKNLAGGGRMRIVNRSVREALANLGADSAEAVVQWIEEHGGVDGCPDLEPEHQSVFDCAFPSSPGGRSIAWRGHVDMMAAVQPFLSGAISKTINMPAAATVEDVREAYIHAWRSGLKCVAIYRDGSKDSQPLVTQIKSTPAITTAPRRERLPDTRASITHKFSIGGHEGYATVGLYPDGRPGELFVTMAKEGSTIGGLMDVWATAVSIGLQYAVPLAVFVDKFTHGRFEPSGFTKNPDVPIASSLTDYLARWMGMQFIEGYRAEHAPNRVAVVSPPTLEPARVQSDAPICGECGSITIRSGTCHRCPNCGATTGCS